MRARFAVWFMDTFVPVVFPRVNPAARWLLKSRLHPLASWYVLLLTFDGRRSGKRYEVPVAYHRGVDDYLEAVTSVHGKWWRNFREGEEISVRYRGEERRARAEVLVGEVSAEAILRALDSRDPCRRLLVPAKVEQTVLLRFVLAPEDGRTGSIDC